jgi:ectoine hydroxylase-related dioxygenase (phytanoyl-CoA dioxygenase family)
MNLLTEKQSDFFREQGYLVIENLITTEELKKYSALYDFFLNGEIDTTGLRSDLSGRHDGQGEYITQIMVPSRIFPELLDQPIHTRSLQLAKELLGIDMELDFDMLINKAPGTATETPWHQDAAYWLDMPDTRAISCWTAIDKATLDNGCMWYAPRSHLGEILPHRQVGDGGALTCEGSESAAVYVELNPGSCVLHHGRTLHYSRGNTTSTHRRALITNFRPQAMIDFEREYGYDHTGKRSVKSQS